MTPKERLFARLQGAEVDQVPNLNIVMLFAARFANLKYGDYCYDFNTLVEAQIKTAETFGIDILSTMSDPFRETADFGATIIRQEDELPMCKEYLINDESDIYKIKLWEPLESFRMLDRINAIKLFKKKQGNKYPILGWVEGSLAQFCDLYNISKAMMLMMDNPDKNIAALEIITKQEIRCAVAQVKAGADIIGIGDAAASLLSAQDYLRYVLPYEKQIINAIHDVGAKAKFHICGDINHILPYIITSGADIVDIDYMVDYENAILLSENKCSICGNINPVDVILQGNPELCRERTRYCIEHGNKKSIISGGCEIPKMTPYINLKSISEEITCR